MSRPKATRTMLAGWCRYHGKAIFSSRSNAKKHARKFKGAHCSPFPCDQVDGHWHLGTTPVSVVRGDLDRSQIRSYPRHITTAPELEAFRARRAALQAAEVPDCD